MPVSVRTLRRLIKKPTSEGLRPLPNRMLPLGFGALAVLTRLSSQRRILHHWDSVNFALLKAPFDISPQFEQPQPRRYILAVGLVKALNALTHDPETSYVWISIVATALAVALSIHLGAIMFGKTGGVVGSLFLLTDPHFWFCREIALPHALDMALVLATVVSLYQEFIIDRRYMVTAALVLAPRWRGSPSFGVFGSTISVHLVASWTYMQSPQRWS
jgi:hypothetical protein